MVDTPFVFGRLAEAGNFTDRKLERQRLEQNFRALTNTTLISPRRWGKSSLVKQVAKDLIAKDKKIKVCSLDLFNVRSEAEFYAQFASAVIKSTSAKWQEWLAFAKEFLTQLHPQISYTSEMCQDITFNVEWESVGKEPDDVLGLPEKIAVAKGIKLIVCIDEFQAVGAFKQSLAFQQKLRSHWQNHQHVCYCLYGSKRHMMLDIVNNPAMPFYRFGDTMLLEKISNDDWGRFINERFQETKKHISLDDACYLAGLVENHSYYVQQLAQQAWLRTERSCSRNIIDTAMAGIKDQLSLQFAYQVESLTARQLGFIRAVLDGVTQLSSTSALQKYKLGTSANIVRIKAALLEMEIIDMLDKRIELLDPVFRYWLEQDYFQAH